LIICEVFINVSIGGSHIPMSFGNWQSDLHSEVYR
jgi:hypothetical protein